MTIQRIEQEARQAQHTPGPWARTEGDRFRHDQSAGVKGPDGIYLATALDFNKYDRDAEVEANARLISAAPDFYHACNGSGSDGERRSRLESLEVVLTECTDLFRAHFAAADPNNALGALQESRDLLAALTAAMQKAA